MKEELNILDAKRIFPDLYHGNEQEIIKDRRPTGIEELLDR